MVYQSICARSIDHASVLCHHDSCFISRFSGSTGFPPFFSLVFSVVQMEWMVLYINDPLKAGASGPETSPVPAAAGGGRRGALGNPARARPGPGLYKRQGLPFTLPFLPIAHAAGLPQPSSLAIFSRLPLSHLLSSLSSLSAPPTPAIFSLTSLLFPPRTRHF